MTRGKSLGEESVVPSPEYYQGTCLRPKAQARETSEVGRGREEEELSVVGIYGVPLRTATGATRGTCHRPLTPELRKKRLSTVKSVLLELLASQPCPLPTNCGSQGRSCTGGWVRLSGSFTGTRARGLHLVV